MVNNNFNVEIQEFLQEFGINKKIIYHCVSRKVPLENLYWADQKNYLDFKVRYLSIPFWLEISYQHNIISLEDLLSENNLTIMERILHYSELEERQIISYDECVEKCSAIEEINLKLMRSPVLKEKIIEMIYSYPSYRALRRGNFIIFYSLIITKNTNFFLKLSRSLVDLLTCGCIIDDLHDVVDDKESGDTNIILELGDNLEAINKIKEMFDKSKINIYQYIPKLENYLDNIFTKSMLQYLLKKYERRV